MPGSDSPVVGVVVVLTVLSTEEMPVAVCSGHYFTKGDDLALRYPGRSCGASPPSPTTPGGKGGRQRHLIH